MGFYKFVKPSSFSRTFASCSTKGGDSHSHLFIDCEMAWKICTEVCDLFGLCWAIPPTVKCFVHSTIHREGVMKW